MAVWLVFSEQVLGRVDAPHRDAAQALAYRKYADHPISRLQSLASYEIGIDERRAAQQRRVYRNNNHENDAA